MPDKDFELPSGAQFHVSLVPFKDARALTKALLKSATGIPLAADIMSMDVTVLKDALISAATSDEVEKAMAVCLERSTWNNLKVVPDLFDDPKSGEQIRRDYFVMCAKVVEVNCMPFFDQALSALKDRLITKTGLPGSK